MPILSSLMFDELFLNKNYTDQNLVSCVMENWLNQVKTQQIHVLRQKLSPAGMDYLV